MDNPTVIIIGGGATGLGILRDLSMRGVKTLLVEKGDLTNGASSRYHGLLHSGGRYAVKDQSAARECIEENQILRRIGKSCVEETEGMFVRLESDDPNYESQWIDGCKSSGIKIKKISVEEALKLEPILTSKIVSAYLVPDAAIDGFRLSWQLVDSAKRFGGEIKTYTRAVGIDSHNGKIIGVRVRNRSGEHEIPCDIVINAAGGWTGKIAEMAGLDVGVQPDKGTLLVFNSRLVNRVVNRLHKSGDGDIFVPHGSVTILGTSSMSVPTPEDTSTSRAEVENLMRIGSELIENLPKYRLLRAFAGSRPLYRPKGGAIGREASRGFAIIDHSTEGLDGMFTIVGGKFTTFRLMAEKISDQVCKKLGNSNPCRTASEPIVAEVSSKSRENVQKFFPSFGLNLAANRLGKDRFEKVAKKLESEPESRQLLCECENITRAEFEVIASEETSTDLDDIRRRTRFGMGTCQGTFCTFRAACIFGKNSAIDSTREMLSERWKGIRPVLIGQSLKQTELMRSIYISSLDVNAGGELF